MVGRCGPNGGGSQGGAAAQYLLPAEGGGVGGDPLNQAMDVLKKRQGALVAILRGGGPFRPVISEAD